MLAFLHHIGWSLTVEPGRLILRRLILRPLSGKLSFPTTSEECSATSRYNPYTWLVAQKTTSVNETPAQTWWSWVWFGRSLRWFCLLDLWFSMQFTRGKRGRLCLRMWKLYLISGLSKVFDSCCCGLRHDLCSMCIPYRRNGWRVGEPSNERWSWFCGYGRLVILPLYSSHWTWLTVQSMILIAAVALTLFHPGFCFPQAQVQKASTASGSEVDIAESQAEKGSASRFLRGSRGSSQ